ncbi:MAG: DNA polymerase III subunit alpha [Nitrospirae bacterium]|nr:MAG: DNA polymerase III subunit alpha [Nitrospirota bacterium]
MHQHSDYVPLHLHTEYSLLDGAIRIKELVAQAKEYRMPAIAITDHGNLFAAVDFYKQVSKAGIKPVIGCEVYVAPGSRFDKSTAENEETSFHLILLARNNAGYKNLVTLVTKAYLEGFYYKPRIDMDLLEQYSGGLIGLSACLKGEIPGYLQKGLMDRAREKALAYKHILGPDNFYLEIQANGLPEQIEVNKKLIELGQELHIGLVATNDSHYLKKSDAKAHEVLLCIQTGKTLKDLNRMKFSSDEFYLKSPLEMKEIFKDVPEAIKNTITIAERCNVEFKLGESLLPQYTAENGEDPHAVLSRLAHTGLEKKFGENAPQAYKERLQTELNVIRKMGYESYFLIVWDFISYARSKGIPVGPGRGSAAGSLVSYCLDITEIDPLKYKLLFERFLNPERISMPDIDVDFCQDRREEVISYVSKKYGEDHVAQIITFGTMAAKAAIRDVGRAMDIPYAEVDKIAKLVPNQLKITIEEALRLEPQLKHSYDNDEVMKGLLDIAIRLEGLNRHASTHAAGVVISPAPLTDYTPLYRNPSDESIVTQFDMESLEKIGLLKFDFLGLKTLTVIEKTLEHITQGGRTLSLDAIPFDDKNTYDLLSSGHTTGVFQLESEGMRDILIRMQPNRFEDLIALVALYRPGPMAWIDDFIKCKKGEKKITYVLPQLKEILDETYGIILYQEQVMMIANKIANFSMGQADILRRAMGKKKAEEMEKQKEVFIKGAVQKGYPEKKAVKLFETMEPFARYGFNKSHSAAYAFIAYQTAYLKTHFPVEFMAATLSLDMNDTDKIVKSINECRKMKIDILPPDINLSGREFRVIGNSIRFGLEAVKGVGGAAIESVLEVRDSGGPFKSIADLVERADSRKVNKKVLEGLVKAGAFDSLGVPRAVSMNAVNEILNNNGKSSRHAGQQSIFGEEPAETETQAEEWDEAELLKNEKEALGFYITGHPLVKYREKLSALHIKRTSELDALADREDVQVAGVISAVRKFQKRGTADTMAYFTIEDEEGNIEAIAFSDLYKSNMPLLKKDTPVIVRGTVDRTEKGIKLLSREISLIDAINSKNGLKCEISIKYSVVNSPNLQGLRQMLSDSSGSCPLYLKMELQDSQVFLATGLQIEPSAALIDKLEGLLGKGAVRIVSSNK